jgi:hypothetical protein
MDPPPVAGGNDDEVSIGKTPDILLFVFCNKLPNILDVIQNQPGFAKPELKWELVRRRVPDDQHGISFEFRF